MSDETWKPLRTLYDGGSDGGDGGNGDTSAGGKEGGDANAGAGGKEGAAPTLPAFEQVLSALPEDLRKEPSVAKMKDLEGMVRSFVSAQKMLGKDPSRLVELPEPTDAEGVRGVLQRLGVPESPEGYKLEPLEGAPDYLAPDQPLAQVFLKAAHEHNVLPQQAQAIYKTVVGSLMEAAKQHAVQVQSTHDENIRTLQKEFGPAFDGKLASANFAVQELGGDELREAIDNAELGTHPALIKALSRVGEMLQEHSLGGEGRGAAGRGGAMTPAEARAHAMDLQRQALNAATAAERKRLNEEAQKYYKLANGGR